MQAHESIYRAGGSYTNQTTTLSVTRERTEARLSRACGVAAPLHDQDNVLSSDDGEEHALR